MDPLWVADTEPDPRFTIYCRGNTGEVFPHVMTALTGTLIGDAVRRGQLEMLERSGVVRPGEVSANAGTGVFGGYLYMNASLMRLFGVRMPGMSADDADTQVIGDVEGLPPYVPLPGDRDLRASVRIMRNMTRILRRPDLGPFDRAAVEARGWLATMPDRSTATDGELLGWLETYPPRLAASMARLLDAAMVVGGSRGVLDRLLDRSGVPAGLANRIVAGTGDVDSARLGQRMWQLGRMVAADQALSDQFDRGVDGLLERLGDDASDGGAFVAELAAFLADHGHRGNDEYELATPAWVMDPTPVLAAIDRLRLAPATRDPVATTHRLADEAGRALTDAERRVPRPVRGLLRRAAAVSRLGSVARERAKDVLVLENLGARLVLHELARRAAERGGPADVRAAFCVTSDELADFVRRPTDFTDVIAERQARYAYLSARLPPPWFDGRIPDPSTWALRADQVDEDPRHGSTLKGIGVSGGQASGRARVVTDPADPRGLEPGDVLVCAITDPSWTPLFLAASAVVCDTGAVQSHAAIVARELGIPAVMSVPGITSVADGTFLHVDGDAGVVQVGVVSDS